MEDKITNLINKFYEGRANAQEEKELREWLSQSKDTKYRPLQQYFALIDAEQNRTLPLDLEQKITASFVEKKKNIWLSPIQLGIAASITFLIIAGMWWNFDLLKKPPQYSEAEIQQSYGDAKSALITMSTYLNHGMRQLSRISALEKPFQDLHKLSEIKFLEEHENK
jgi:hypothetical protein